MTNDNKNSFNLIWKYLCKGNIHWPILTSYDFNIHRNSCPCYPSKYFRIWNDNEVTVAISFGMGISFFNRLVQKLFSYILFNWPYLEMYWSYNQNIFVVITDIYEVYYVANEKKIHCAYAPNFESKEATISFDPTLTRNIYLTNFYVLNVKGVTCMKFLRKKSSNLGILDHKTIPKKT